MSKEAEKTVAVTGAGGFVGRALAAELAARGATMLPLSRASTDRWSETMAGADAVVHLAALSGGRHPEEAYRAANVDLSTTAYEAARKAGVKRFIFVSSINVHGAASPAPLAPEAPLSGSRNLYARSKIAAEEALRRLAAGSPTELIIVRPPPVFGPGGRNNLSVLANVLARGLPLPLGQARGRRALISSRNLAHALATAAHAPKAPAIFLPAESEDWSLRDLVQLIAQSNGRSATLLPVPGALARAGLSLLGKSAIADTLFGELAVDRGHWQGFWAPPHDTQTMIATTFGRS